MKLPSPIWLFFSLVFGSFQFGWVQAASPPPLSVVAKITDFRPVDYPIIPYDDRLYFSQYDESGNNFDVIAFDIANQSSEYVLRGRYGGQFVAQSDKYLVVGEKGRLANPLVVIDRASGQRMKQIGLRHRITWARIKGNRLLAIQGAGIGGSGYSTRAQALIFELPSLKVTKSVEIVGGNDVQDWEGKILSLGYDLAAYDDEFNELFKIVLPVRKRGEGVSCAATWPLRIHADKAVIVANCGELLIYDLRARQLERTIPSYAHFYAVAVLDGLIFTTPINDPRQRDYAKVYDLYTGRELAVLPITATDLFAKGNRLLAVERQFAKPAPMTLYSVDFSAVRGSQWRLEQVLAECQKAETQLKSSSDLYSSIALCKSAGIEGMVDEAVSTKAILPHLKRYAIWLSQTFDRGRDAIPILEQLQKIAPDGEIDRVSAEVRLKTKVLEGRELGNLTEQEKQTDFARILERGRQLRRAETMALDFGSFSNLFHFSEDRIYVGRYGCRKCPDGGASIGVLDRTTFREMASIPIAPNDDEYQDAIRSVTSDANRIYVSVEYRYEQAGRPNFFVVDKDSHKVIKKAQLKSVFSLISDSGRLLACGCHFTEGHTCKVLDPVAAKTADAPGKICIRNEHGSVSVINFEGVSGSIPYFVANTKDYLVSRPIRPRDAPYTIFPKAGGPPKLVQQQLGDALSWPVSVDGNSILIIEGTRGGRLIRIVSASTGSVQTLFGVPTTRSRIPIPVLYKESLFVGLGRDLLIYDLTSNRLQSYIKDFIPGGFKDNGNGLDMHRIGRLIIDRGRLVSITFYGDNSRVVQLTELTGAGK